MFPENLHLVPDGGIRVRDIDHAGVHADVADDRNSFPFDEHVTDTIAQVTVQPVGIPDRDYGNPGGTGGVTFAPVPDGLAFRNLTDGRDVGLETTYRLEVGVRGTDTV